MIGEMRKRIIKEGAERCELKEIYLLLLVLKMEEGNLSQGMLETTGS